MEGRVQLCMQVMRKTITDDPDGVTWYTTEGVCLCKCNYSKLYVIYFYATNATECVYVSYCKDTLKFCLYKLLHVVHCGILGFRRFKTEREVHFTWKFWLHDIVFDSVINNTNKVVWTVLYAVLKEFKVMSKGHNSVTWKHPFNNVHVFNKKMYKFNWANKLQLIGLMWCLEKHKF